jgi:anti-sigma regulatory factor (Ser/Thr protein kinase)
MIEDSFTCELKNHIEQLGILCRAIERFVIAHALPKRIFFDLNLVLEEVFTNIVQHGFMDDQEHRIQISVFYEDGVVIVQVEDDGIPFNLAEAKRPHLRCPLEQRQVGGLGIHLVKRIMDDIVYSRKGRKNILTMKKVVG